MFTVNLPYQKFKHIFLKFVWFGAKQIRMGRAIKLEAEAGTKYCGPGVEGISPARKRGGVLRQAWGGGSSSLSPFPGHHLLRLTRPLFFPLPLRPSTPSSPRLLLTCTMATIIMQPTAVQRCPCRARYAEKHYGQPCVHPSHS